MATAALLAVGSELLLPARAETNTLWLTEELFDLGVPVLLRLVVGDDTGETAAALEAALARCDLVLLTGGLGPTDDDRVREALSQVFGAALERRAELEEALERAYERFGSRPTEGSLRQADVPAGARTLPNPVGTARGLWLESDRGTAVAFPGVPEEMKAIWRETARGAVAERFGGPAPARALLRTTGLGESHVAARLPAELPAGVERTILASPGSVDVHHLAWDRTVGEGVRRAHEEARGVLGDAVYAEKAEEIETVVARLLSERGETLALAESCTGGLLAHRLTEVPGASAFLLAGHVVYSDAAKSRELGVEEDLLRRHGAVSEPVARSLAEAARLRAGADWGVGVTGIAGPGGGTAQKPVGTVHLAVAGPDGAVHHEVDRFPGDRSQVKRRSSQRALDMLRRGLLRGAG